MADDYLELVKEKEEDYLKLVKDKGNEFSDLWARMDDDKKLLVLDEYTMQDADGRNEPDVDNITMNDAAVFASKVHNTLIRAEIVPEVEGEKLKDKETTLVENFIRDIGLEADACLSQRDVSSFKDWEIMQACDRGRIARRITLRLDDEDNTKLSPDSFTEVDTRYLLYEPGLKGLKWVATKMSRSKEDIEDEYGKEVRQKNAIVTDFWNDEVECVYVGREKVKEEENFWKEPPFVIQVVPSGLAIMDDDRILYSGESIFSLDRELFGEKNQFATILKSLTVRSFFNGLQLEVNDIALAKRPKEPPYGKKFVVPIEKGTKGYFNMPIEDLTNAARTFYSILDSALQDGAFPKVSYGTLQFPISAVGMAELKEAEDPVYFPRIQGLALFWQRVYRMVIKQYTDQKLNIELGEPGFRKQYSYKDLDLDFSLKFRFYISSPKQDMVNISTAAATGDLVSEDTKRRDYLHLQDPAKEATKLLAEKAARMSPAVAMYDVIKGLIDNGEEIKAKIMLKELGMTLDQLLKGNIPQKENPLRAGNPPTQLMPLFRGTGSTGPGKPAGSNLAGEIPEKVG